MNISHELHIFFIEFYKLEFCIQSLEHFFWSVCILSCLLDNFLYTFVFSNIQSMKILYLFRDLVLFLNDFIGFLQEEHKRSITERLIFLKHIS